MVSAGSGTWLATLEHLTRIHFPPCEQRRLPEPLYDLFQQRGVPCSLEDGETALSPWPPSGVRWMAAKSVDVEVCLVIKEFKTSLKERRYTSSRGNATLLSSLPCTSSLPAQSEILILVDGYVRQFNHFSPLFNYSTFMNEFQQHVVKRQLSGLSLIASINVVLAVGRRLLDVIDSTFPSTVAVEISDQYNENAQKLIPHILLQPPSLLNAQVLTGIVGSYGVKTLVQPIDLCFL